jgi:hypothetical protein
MAFTSVLRLAAHASALTYETLYSGMIGKQPDRQGMNMHTEQNEGRNHFNQFSMQQGPMCLHLIYWCKRRPLLIHR